MAVIRNGSAGPAVKRWQYFLVGRGFATPVDGKFGNETEQATLEFQRKHRLHVDGVVGNQTLGFAGTLGYEIVDYVSATDSGYPPKPALSPLVGDRDRARIFGKFDYTHEPLPDNKENIRILGSWEKDNIVVVPVPQLETIGSGKYKRARVHKLVAAPLVKLWNAWEKAGLLDRVLSWEGAYMPRFVRGSRTTLSNHAFGSAFDINANWNRRGAEPALPGAKGCLLELVPIANKHGFYWGGHFGLRDGMHFEYAG